MNCAQTGTARRDVWPTGVQMRQSAAPHDMNMPGDGGPRPGTAHSFSCSGTNQPNLLSQVIQLNQEKVSVHKTASDHTCDGHGLWRAGTGADNLWPQPPGLEDVGGTTRVIWTLHETEWTRELSRRPSGTQCGRCLVPGPDAVPFTSINPSVSWWEGAVSTKNRMHAAMANKKLTLTPC